MLGGEFALAVISGGLGYALADVADRYFATYDPGGSSTPTNKFTSPNGTLANTLNIASPPGMVRIGVGLGSTVVLGLGAAVVRNRMAKAALQGATLGAAIKLFSNLFNGYVMTNLLKSSAQQNAASIGNRLYPAEITAALNIASATGSPQVSGLLSKKQNGLSDRTTPPNAPTYSPPAVPYGGGGGTGGGGSEASSTPTPPAVSPPVIPYGGIGPGAPPVGSPPSSPPIAGQCTDCGCTTGDCGCGLASKPNGLSGQFAFIGLE